MKKPPFINDNIYHIYNRGVEKRNIFTDDGDYVRFVHHLFSFNDKNTPKNLRSTAFKTNSINEVRPRLLKREPLVDVLAFALMPNHYHLLIKQRVDGGIVKFMQKVGTGFSMFFNKKYDRVGSLFQGKFKAVLIDKDAHFMYIPHYIHTNPISLFYKQNKRGSTSFIDQMAFLENYRWSSFKDYIGKKNFPSVTERDFLLEFFGGTEKYRLDRSGFLSEKKNDGNDFDNSILLDINLD